LQGVKVIATDLIEPRLRLAKKFGAHWAVLANKLMATALPRLDAAVIAVPSDAAVKQALQLVRGAGQVLPFAHTKRGALSEIDLASVCLDEKDLIGSYSCDFTLQREVAQLVFSRKMDVRGLITHRFPLAETADAIKLAANPKPDSLKILTVQ